MRGTVVVGWLLLAAVWVSCAGQAAGASAASPREETQNILSPRGNAVDDFATALDLLPVLPSGVTVHEFSSHNKRGDNGDAGWYLYKDEHGDFVIFDVIGPGRLKSLWQTAIAAGQQLKFYFDGEAAPRYTIPSADLYEGTHTLFPSPLASYRIAGRYEGLQYAANSFVPVPFAASLKIAVTADPGFYHIIYERYPYGTEIATFTGKEDNSSLVRAFTAQGEDLAPDASAEVISAQSDGIPPGGALDVLSLERPGVLRKFVIEGDGSDDFLQHVEVEMSWDGSAVPDVIAPVGMFFACPRKAENVRAMPIKVEKIESDREAGRLRLTCYWRMPFWQKAHIRLVNRITSPAHSTGPVRTDVSVAPQTYDRERCGYFTTLYRQGRTEMGRDWLLFDGIGTGWFVGVVQTMFGGHYCEGDEHFALDGAGMPQINGTGSEDYYLGCFWPNVNYNLPFAGCVGDAHIEGGGYFEGAYNVPGCYYRFHLEAPIPFYSQVDARIQHGPASNILSQYSSLAFCYWRRRPALVQTDFIDVASAASERAHAYMASESTLTGDLDARYEGNSFRTTVRDAGRTHAGGEISFSAAIAAANSGVRLRRRLDQSVPRQCAEVYVDGEFAGTWYHPDQNEFLRWYDSDFDIHPRLTRGKDTLSVRLVVKTDAGHGPFTDFRYTVLTFAEVAR